MTDRTEFDSLNAARRKAGRLPIRWEDFRKHSVQAKNIAIHRKSDGRLLISKQSGEANKARKAV